MVCITVPLESQQAIPPVDFRTRSCSKASNKNSPFIRSSGRRILGRVAVSRRALGLVVRMGALQGSLGPFQSLASMLQACFKFFFFK